MIVYLVPAGRERFELYSEAHEEGVDGTPRPTGVLRRWVHAARAQWQELVESSRRGAGSGMFAHWRNRIVSRLAETVAEQRTLWALTNRNRATVRFASTLEAETARTILFAAVARARRHHARWLIVDGVLLTISALLALVPGPNLLAYYLAFRVIGHAQSWRGARQAMSRVSWTFEPDPALTELGQLVDMPREARASRVAAIASRLNLQRLSAFFDRVAVPSA
jgi:hypothetical protein